MKPKIIPATWNIRQQKTTNQNSKNKKESKKYEDSVRNLRDNFKHTNIHIIGILKGEEKEQEIENLFEQKVKENFPNLVKEIDMQVHEAQRVQSNWTQGGAHQSTS